MLDVYDKNQLPPALKESPYSDEVLIYTEDGDPYIAYYDYNNKYWWANTEDGWERNFTKDFKWIYIPKELIDKMNYWKEDDRPDNNG